MLRYDQGEVAHAVYGRPTEPAPPRTASYEARAEWSERYVAWYLAHIEEISQLPPDVDSTHLYEVEFNSCVLNPQEYERDTQEELADLADVKTIH